MAEVVATSTQPALGAIRLAWWREALERLDQSPPPAEPRLQAAAEHLLPRGVSGAMLAALEDGHNALLEERVEPSRVASGGERLFGMGALVLGKDDTMLARAGRLYALGQAARGANLLTSADENLKALNLVGHRFAKGVRPLSAMAKLSVRDLARFPAIEPEATPARAAALLIHRFTGIIA